MPTDDFPLIVDYHPDRGFAWRDGRRLTCGRALADILALAQCLTFGRAYLNICADRYRFTVAFAAVCLAGGRNLLPSSHVAGAIEDVRRDYPQAGILDDDRAAAWLAAPQAAAPDRVPTIAGSHCAAVAFTSGSTGRPTAHPKSWRQLQIGTNLCRQRLFAHGQAPNLVATVPPQHMYGLETSVLTVLQAGFAAHGGRPSMPWEIAQALAEIPAPRVLITTPIHLSACLRAGTAMPELTLAISATAALPAATARRLEQAWNAPIYEIYGCTEGGSLASRRTSEDAPWTLYDGMRLAPATTPKVHGPQLPEPIVLDDDLQLLDARHFRLLGRSRELLKVAGKRLALGELTRRLLDIDGVDDAVVFLPTAGEDRQRPAALVVAPGLSKRHIAAQLAERIDPVFVPRPLLQVPALPRNAVGKLPRAALEAMLAERRKPGRRS